MKTWIFIILMIISITHKCNGQDKNEVSSGNVSTLRDRVFDGLLKKIKKISEETVSNISNNVKGNTLQTIEAKLRKAAEPFGKKGEKYVNLIMRGLRVRNISKSLRSHESRETIRGTTSNDGENNTDLGNSRDAIINVIMDKINKISLESLNNVTNNDEKEKTLKEIESKIQKAAQSFGKNAERYMNLIMRAVRDKFHKMKPKQLKSIADSLRRSSHIKNENNDNDRNAIIELIIKKINKITEGNDNESDQLNILENKLREAALPLGNKGLKYIKLIMRALRSNKNNVGSRDADPMSEEVEEVAQEAIKLNNIVKRNGNKKTREQAVKNIAKAILDIVNKEPQAKRYEEVIEKFKKKTFESMKTNGIINNNDEIKLLSDFMVDSINAAGKEYLTKRRTNEIITRSKNEFYNQKPSKSELLCKNTVQRTCASIKDMNNLKCAYMKEQISFQNLCDGKYDCIDRSDESRCAQQAIEKVRYAQSVLSALEISLENDCLTNDINENILSKQNLILRDVLRAQLSFIAKYKDENYIQSLKNMDTTKENTSSPVREITDVISTLTIALDKALCTSNEYVKKADKLRRYNEILKQDEEVIEAVQSWPPKNCRCTEQLCLNCTSSCKRVCWHKRSLSQWNCDSVNDTSMVPLQVLCDGKYDCYDESDERECFTDNVHGKFEAHQVFSAISESLKLKASKEIKPVKKKIWTLLNTVTSLEKLSLNSNPNPSDIKELRDISFKLLAVLYSEILKRTTYPYEAEDVYLFLLSINQQLGSALKRIGTGNKRIISDNCFCRKGKCAATVCSRRCQKACVVETILTRYYCDKGNSNKSVDLDSVCDGKADCPRENDEKECSNEVCRSHHITVLQHKVQETGVKKKGTAMGEVLSTWKIKVLAALKIAEKDTPRPTKKIIRDLVKDILRDLVLAFGSVEEYRRKDNNYAIEDFKNIAETIITTLKSCGK